MTATTLIDIYSEDPRLNDWAEAWRTANPGTATALTGVQGSLQAVAAAAACHVLQKKIIVIRRDREEAAYFYNDLEKLMGEGRALYFPESYRQPYADREIVNNANIGLRAEVLHKFSHSQAFIVVTYPEAVGEKVITKKTLKNQSFRIHQGDQLSLDFLNESLFELGFERVDFVDKPGQFAVRGGIVDVFSFASLDPYRIEFFGNEVDSIRSFAIDTQLSIASVKNMQLVANVEDKHLEQRESLWDHAGNNVMLWVADPKLTQDKVENLYSEAEAAFVNLESHDGISHVPPKELYLSGLGFAASMGKKNIAIDAAQGQGSWNTLSQPAFNKAFDLLADTLKGHAEQQRKIYLMTANPAQRKRLDAIFEDITEAELPVQWIDGALHEGWEDPQRNLIVYTDHQIFERYQRFDIHKRKQAAEAITLKELNALQVGDFVAHQDHGIGKFGGLQKIDVGGTMQEAIKLVYQDRDILYVSIHSLHKISKFNSKEGTEPKLNKLGSPAWQNLKKKTKAKVKKMAYDLIQLYAKRREAKGFAFSPDSFLQHELEASFMYEDTPDQVQATADIKSDMEREMPMDRLICGDVGFGKTELAIRAAFKAVADGKQVALLVPTTLLAFQHYQTFKKRLEGFPVKVDYLNRSRGAKATREILEQAASGELDILIGTHKLASKDMAFHDLGLLIIDEEQKFGVNVKDKLKTLKVNVDTLTLTATPIPRTMQFSLMAARDLSVMKTPPPNRQPVQTQVVGFNEELIRDAVQYEISRGGQVFFIHNRVQNIQEVAGMLQRLLPDARIAIGHGQMKGSDLEAILLDFMEGRYDILISTTIVESGLDVPNANTILINQAHMFGLSDLHQMRGRVGRSNRKAFCYLMAPPLSGLPDESRKRLQALEQFSDLGSGFKIAMRDLEIRGAGDLLGAEQSGFINDLGFETYQKLLSEAVDELKKKDFKELYDDVRGGWEDRVRDCQLDTDLELLLPDDYINYVEERLQVYQSLNQLKGPDDLPAFAAGLEDRFGPLPQVAHNLMESMRLRWIGDDLGIEKIILKSSKLIAHFPDDPELAPPQHILMPFLSAIQSDPKRYRMKQKGDRISLVIDGIHSIEEAQQILSSFQIQSEAQ